jgi:CRP-like cAMP-binding protein
VISGFACRYKVLRNGSRQIVALLVPGDFCDLHVAILGTMDYSIATLSPCTIADLSRATVLDLTEQYPRIGRALWWATLVDEAVSREWLVNIGRREAPQRMAHLFCELLMRFQAVGLADGDSCPFPLTQVDLADALGLTPVHVNRTVQALRQAGLIVLQKRRLAIPDVDSLKMFCDFDPEYLHLVKRQG